MSIIKPEEMQRCLKENEIVVIPKILDSMDIEGATISIDAAGTQVNIARKIREHKDGLSLHKKVFKAALNKEYLRQLLVDFKF